MDSIRMFSSYFDVIIMRSPITNLAECCAYMMNRLESQEMRAVPTINAGSGSDEHPTQALWICTPSNALSIFDISNSNQERFHSLKQKYPDVTAGPANKTYLFCGDIGRGRTVRSLATVLSRYRGQRMFFVAPDHDVLKLDSDLMARLKSSGVEVHEFQSLDATIDNRPILSEVDCLYMTRIQREHNSPEITEEISSLDLGPFQLTMERVNELRDYSPIMHPFPRDSVVQEIPTDVDTDSRVMYFRQARNGMWVRAALLVHLLDAAEELFGEFQVQHRRHATSTTVVVCNFPMVLSNVL